jgi:hypothetical protein
MPRPPLHANVHIHPALRDRVLRVSSDPRLKFLARSGDGAATLETAIAHLESLTPATCPHLDSADFRAMGAIAAVLRLTCGRLTAWENGEWPTRDEASAVVDGLSHCRRLLTTWERMIENRAR